MSSPSEKLPSRPTRCHYCIHRKGPGSTGACLYASLAKANLFLRCLHVPNCPALTGDKPLHGGGLALCLPFSYTCTDAQAGSPVAGTLLTRVQNDPRQELLHSTPAYVWSPKAWVQADFYDPSSNAYVRVHLAECDCLVKPSRCRRPQATIRGTVL